MADSQTVPPTEKSRLAALQEIALTVTSSLDLQEVLNKILAEATRLLGARNGSIMLLDDQTQELSILVATGLSEDIIRQTRVRLGEGVAGRVALDGQPCLLGFGERHQDSQDRYGDKVQEAIVVPLRTQGRIIGVLNVSDKIEGDAFTDSDVELLMALASQSAVAIENARLFAEAQTQARELAALHEIGVAVNSSLEQNEVLQQVLDKAIELLQARQGSLLLLEEDGQHLRIAVAHGLPPEVVRTTRIRLGEGIAGQVAATGEPRRLQRGVREESSQSDAGRPLPAALCVPLKVQDQVIGVLNVSDRRDGGNFTEANLRLLNTLAAQAAIAIHNAQLYQDLQNRASQLAALNQIAVALSSSLDRDQILQQVLANALPLLHARSGSLMLLEGDWDEDEEPEPLRAMRIVVAQGLPEEVVREARIPLGEGIAGMVAATGEPRLLRRGVRDEQSQSVKDGRQAKSALSVPLKAKGRVIGVLNLSDRENEGDFSEDNLQLATTLASQAAAAIENAKLYDDVRDMFTQTIRTIANAIDARDPYTRGHSQRVTEYAVLIARELGLSEDDVEAIRHAGLLHDVGKIGIRDAVLLKPGKLTDEEFEKMKQHPALGANIISEVKKLLRDVVPSMKYHHERYASQGYPEGLQGEQIPLAARIIAVADSYDAMVTDRPYRKALPRSVAVQELERGSHQQFDPQVVEAFLKVIGKGLVEEIERQGRQSLESAA